MRGREPYRAGIYLRLSREDGLSGGCGESDSIRSQRELCRAFIREQSDIELYDVYIDDGYSGANYDRPEFKRLMEDVREGNVNCIVVKDLSRLGRDYIETGRLIQKTFPVFHVRFIALTDHYDSLSADYNETSLVVPIKNFVNDSYCRDISCKVRAHQKLKREKGEFIGAFTVYGYRRDEKNKNRLVPDEYAARVVADIFCWRIQGMSCLAIAKRLNERGILPPLAYKRSRGEHFATGFVCHAAGEWSSVAVKRILDNEIYTGVLVQGKSEKINYKSAQCRAKPREQWTRVEGAHQAIVSREDFAAVQRLSHMDSRAKSGAPHLFSGLLFCGDCGSPMIRRLNRCKGDARVHFICGKGNRGRGCSRHSVSEEELETALGLAISQQIKLFGDEGPLFCRKGTGRTRSDAKILAEEVKRLRSEAEKYASLQAGLYQDFKEGLITREDYGCFHEIYEAQREQIKRAAARQEELLCARRPTDESLSEAPREQLGDGKLSREMLVAFTGRILVYEGKRICLEWRGFFPLEYGLQEGGTQVPEV